MRTLSRFVLALLFFAAVASTVHAQDAERMVSDTVPLDANGTVSVDNHDGEIRITTWDRSEVSYEARIVHDEQDNIDQTKIRVQSSNGRVSIESDFDDVENDGFWGGRSVPDVYYTLRVPRTASVEIDDHGSDLTIEGLQGDVDVDKHDGEIVLSDIDGDVEIDTHDSPIRLSNIAGAVEIDTHDGSVEATGLQGPFEVDTHDGKIDAAFTSLNDGVEIDSHDARVILRLPAEAAFTLRTDMGDDARIDVEPEMNVESRDEGDLRATVNGGGPEIYVSSHDGSVTIRNQ
ncbi:hypothetical protein CRI94_06840 [Longibacter salinarum]|uniref:DUF4097 domain-containing protein n=1 Tax=Longibacter salinarum TaxID=1850348 RepID=A0A2A8CYG7_9BACT|nr:DUF4097 family beta strand repeat-containing protein [Longibacter salinarum]PEN13779.1 hypothetical protein CRI94_06840 [Longibacter salinarum]